MTRYERFPCEKVELADVDGRGHKLLAEDCLPLAPPSQPFEHAEFVELIERITAARRDGRPVILMMGAHPIKLGLSRFLVDLIARRLVTHVAANGATLIHDFEMATLGGTSEDVARWIQAGQFGLWHETSRLNDLAAAAVQSDEGLGEHVGRVLEEEQPPHIALSLAAAAYRAEVPMTIHVGIGNDIVHAHANCDGAAWGQASHTDFLLFARSVQDLEGGVLLNLGSAITGPEVYLKALAMARNVARQRGEEVRRFTTAVFDLIELPDGWRAGPPSMDHPHYYYRPWKTILHRTVADGGQSYYFCGDHLQTVPTLWHALTS